MAKRCIQLLNLPQNSCLLLDIGCGSGLSGDIINEYGYAFVGMDISDDMLNLAVEREVDGDLYKSDIGQGFKFRAGIFDGAISVSVLQWLFVASKKDYVPYKRLSKFFQGLYNSLAAGARAIFQFYPDSADQVEMATSAAMKAGFKTALIVDYPDSKRNRKIYLVTCAGDGDLSNIQPLLGNEEDEYVDVDEEGGIIEENKADDDDDDAISDDGKKKVENISKKSKQIARQNPTTYKKKKKVQVKSKEWIIKKKERQRKQGKKVRPDSKYTGRKRKNYF